MTLESEKHRQDAKRLLSNALHMLHSLEVTGYGNAPPCHSPGELMLQDALLYLSNGQVNEAKGVIADYEHWQRTGEANWPYGSPPKSLDALNS